MNKLMGNIFQKQWSDIFWPAVSVFFVFMLSFIAWRWSWFIVWDDTASTGYNKFVSRHHTMDGVGTIIKEAISGIRSDGYRPIHYVFRSLGNAFVFSYGLNTHLFIVLNGFMFGLAALIYCHVSGFFLQNKIGRILAMFLFFASTPVLSGTLVLTSGIQLQLFITFLTILAIYLHHDQDGRNIWLVPLSIFLLAGPWVHEFIGIAAALILVREVIYFRGLRPAGIIAFFGFSHALFPTFLASLFFKGLPVSMVHKIGNLRNFLASPDELSIWGNIQNLHWRIFGDIFSIIPPSLLAVGFFAFCWSSLTYWRTSPEEFRKQLFLFIFFGATFVPFIKVFNEHVHLAYCLMPLSILLAKQIMFLYNKLDFKSLNKKAVAFILLLVVTIADHTVNIFSVRNVTREMYRIIISIADGFKKELPRHTVVVSNAHHIEDIRFYTNGHIDPWNSGGAIPDQSHWLKGDVGDFMVWLKRWRANNRDVYFLDMRLPRNKGQRGANRVHTFVRDQFINTKSLGRIASMRYTYPFFDPLRFLLPTLVSKWPGPPDLEFDFYRGPALSNSPFMKEVALDYYFYKVTGTSLKTTSDWSVPTLLKQNVMGFNIIGYRGRVFAIPQTEGAFDINKIYQNRYSRVFKGKSVERVTRDIRLAHGLNLRKNIWAVPTLLEKNVHGFNIVGYQGRVFGIPQSEGAFELRRVENGSYSQIFSGKDSATVKANILKVYLKN